MQTTAPALGIVAAAKAARQALEWARAALLFTQAADIIAVQENPHQIPTAEESGLRRDAHLCLCRTPEFIKYRTRRPSTVCCQEWLHPDGSLIDHLLGGTTEPRIHLRTRVEAC